MQFHFPQYIDIEDKLFGPLSLKQAIYTAGGIGAVYAVYVYIPYLFLSVPIIVSIGVLTWALAFYPKEKLGRPFIEVLEAGFYYLLREKLYTWKKTTKEPVLGQVENYTPTQAPLTPVIPQGKLSSSSFGIDIKGPEIERERDDELVVRGKSSILSGPASAEAGTLSVDSYILQQKTPKVDTFVTPKNAEHSPYKTPPSPSASATKTEIKK
ncbi:MAG: hypothetical protein A3B07_00445 [Candidatus Yonathbacteria bacterium RIFCSPLOWO2_01_FULL_43_27]|uniref:PrgI family protein n=1 Tax=Candidatus Yonathbacteria bacterium RIFCSPLOWO2_01_FULL_43_27 TaxID=1802726 RepID=A0A1G2SEX0_9BACT|nr:MAG: hypothetical protein A2658_00895 [Candidatus Yonathbacteria bacterium RIFCSPHIGHO2_01_FULL_44_19]OHA83222.1 MAG: hypothetical protein A3B07_00445 [Candidatus Yonathbacteria bacterium RIFCSPLOWO2_01_FULL_43_27]